MSLFLERMLQVASTGLRLVVARLGVGSPLTMYRMDLAERAIWLPLRSMLTNGALPREGTCTSVVTTEEGNG
jgi:hypothetical protein